MIPQSLSAIWAAIARPMANHLWQSTAFLAAAALLTLALRKNQARVRYWLWLAASIKFLIPFSLLIAAGGYLRPATVAPMATPVVSAVMEQVTQPFPQTQFFDAPLSLSPTHHSAWLPMALLAVWFCGVLVVAIRFGRGLLRVWSAKRVARPLELAAGVPVLCSPALIEPGIFGISRPVLLLPEGILERLTPEQLKAIFAHEMCHVQRRDNLTFAAHMVVETLFWFYPPVWWIGARLIDERERACDEAVLEAGGGAEAYAEGILNVCKFYAESPLKCVAGVTGANLKTRIVRIMSEHVARKLNFSRKLLLTTAGLIAVGVPIVFGQLNAKQSGAGSQVEDPANLPTPQFEVASVKQNDSGSALCKTVPFSCYVDLGRPGFVIALNATARELIGAAWDLTDFQTERIFGGPKWVNTARFDVQARAEGTSGLAQKRLMLQTLLADRFKLAVENTRQQGPMYALELVTDGKLGPRLLPHSDISTCIDLSAGRPRDPIRIGSALCGGFLNLSKGGAGYLAGNNVTLDRLTEQISRSPDVERTVVNRTGLTGKFDITLEYAFITGKLDHSDVVPADISAPNVVQALKEQLGLKLVSTKGTIDVLVIDHIEKPSAN
jgi:bla regulator protein blaR1